MTADQANAASELFQSADYKALSPAEKATVAEAWRNAKGNASAVKDVQQLLQSPAFKAADADLRADLLRGVALVHSDAFKALPAADQQLVRDALAARKSGDTQLAQKLCNLMDSDSFKKLSQDEKTAVLSQVRNYPTSEVTYKVAASGALGNPGEAAKIFAHLSQLTDVPVTADNYKAVLADPSKWQPPGDEAIPAGAKPKGNTDNH